MISGPTRVVLGSEDKQTASPVLPRYFIKPQKGFTNCPRSLQEQPETSSNSQRHYWLQQKLGMNLMVSSDHPISQAALHHIRVIRIRSHPLLMRFSKHKHPNINNGQHFCSIPSTQLQDKRFITLTPQRRRLEHRDSKQRTQARTGSK